MEEFILVNDKNFEKVRKRIRELKNQNKKVIFTSDDDELNRKVLEKLEINLLLLNLARRKDFQKQRNSGFNQVLAKTAGKNSVIIGINLDEIISTRGKEKSEILGRLIQNIRLCNKNKLKMKFISKKYDRNIYDLGALGLILRMPTWMTKELK
ncbi:MAG: hypothetical protein KKF67_03950 [Nanoarchaeota archaeon]|nr:hypothetical protein [Nanoarchaeota archaeon]